MLFRYVQHPETGIRTDLACFSADGGADEIHLSITARPGGDFRFRLRELETAYRYALDTCGIAVDSAIFRRVFISDASNQTMISESPLVTGSGGFGQAAVSIVEQPPLPEAKLSLWAYHLMDSNPYEIESPEDGWLCVRRNSRTHCWSAGITPGEEKNMPPDAARQTERLFEQYLRRLEAWGGFLSRSVIRTWLFVQNVDVNYAGMVTARKRLFEKHGLTAETHYITSTGIEGRHADPRRLILLDAYAVPEIEEKHITFLNAPDRLGPTHLYGVTFERGIKIEYGDRFHVFIAGTASIEPNGNTVHKEDIRKQTERTFGNIEGLLRNAEADFEDVAHMIVYLRDGADKTWVEAYLTERFPDTPRNLVRAPVCRPDWLIEVECLAIRSNDNRTIARF